VRRLQWQLRRCQRASGRSRVREGVRPILGERLQESGDGHPPGDSSRRVGRVTCRKPQGQQEGNLAFDPTVAKAQGREEGTFDGCAYAWDEAYASSGADVQPRC
jgi:hypothetical protein